MMTVVLGLILATIRKQMFGKQRTWWVLLLSFKPNDLQYNRTTRSIIFLQRVSVIFDYKTKRRLDSNLGYLRCCHFCATQFISTDLLSILMTSYLKTLPRTGQIKNVPFRFVSEHPGGQRSKQKSEERREESF